MMIRLVRRAAAIGLAVGVTTTVALQPWIAEAHRFPARMPAANTAKRNREESASRSIRPQAEETNDAAPRTSGLSGFNPLTRLRDRVFGKKADTETETSGLNPNGLNSNGLNTSGLSPNGRSPRGAAVDPFANDDDVQPAPRRTASSQTDARESQRVRLLPKPGEVEARRAALETQALRQSSGMTEDGEARIARERAVPSARRRAAAALTTTRDAEQDSDFDAALSAASVDAERRSSRARTETRNGGDSTGVARVGATSKQPRLKPVPVADEEFADESDPAMEFDEPISAPATRAPRTIGRARVGGPAPAADETPNTGTAARMAKKATKKKPTITPSRTTPSTTTPSRAESSSEQLVRRRADELMDRAQQAILARDTAAAIRLARIAEQLESAVRDTYRPGQVRPSEFLKKLESQLRSSSSSSIANNTSSGSNTAWITNSNLTATVTANSAAGGTAYRDLRSFHGGEDETAVRSNQGVVVAKAAAGARTGVSNSNTNSGSDDLAERDSAFTASASESTAGFESGASSTDDAGPRLQAPVVASDSAASDPTVETESETEVAVARAGPVVIDTEAATKEATASSQTWSPGRILLGVASCLGLLLGVAGLVGLNWYRRTRREQTPPPSGAAVATPVEVLKVTRHAA